MITGYNPWRRKLFKKRKNTVRDENEKHIFATITTTTAEMPLSKALNLPTAPAELLSG